MKEKKEGEVNNRKKIMLVVGILCIVSILLIGGISYALWQTTKVQEDTNIIAGGCFDVTLEGENPIELVNTYPLLDEEGQATIPYTFTIKNKCNVKTKYDVNLESLVNSSFDASKIKVMINEDMRLYENFTSTEKYFENSKEARLLARGTLDEKESVTYNLRIWVDKNVTLEDQNKTFDSKIIIQASLDISDASITNLESSSSLDTINITYNTNGTIVPATCKWGIKEGIYDNKVIDASAYNCKVTGLVADTVIYYQICTETGNGNKCVEGTASTKESMPVSELTQGEYIKMIPVSTSYKVDGTLTGTANQSINPSEITTWQNLKRNEDGTVLAIANNTSSNTISFKGKMGYMNFIDVVETIGEQYTNPLYTISSKSFGYNSQTKIITDSTKLDSKTLPWPNSTENNDNEVLGGGDTLYSSDELLMWNVVNHLRANNVNGIPSSYWVASRVYYTMKDLPNGFGLEGRSVDETGSLGSKSLYGYDGTWDWSDTSEAAIRPMIELKADAKFIKGDGLTPETAYSFE